MVIGERLRSARRTAGMSQRDLGEAVGRSAMAICKYERGLDVPSSGVLLRLAEALQVQTEYFVRPMTVELSKPSYRRRMSLPRKQESAILGQVQEWLERYLEVEALLGLMPVFELPAGLDRRVRQVDEAERVAEELRRGWDLGLDPIESLVEVLEEKGIKVGLVEGHDDFDALTVWANQSAPVIVLKRDLPGDRQRLSLAHELAHLVLQPADDVDVEKAAFRFAGAFLVPASAARFELGERRRTLGMDELHMLKHKYGLSMQAWVYRARGLAILSEPAARRLFEQFRRQGGHRKEPGVPVPSEEPRRLNRLVLRALAEDLISQTRAAELLGMPLAELSRVDEGQHEWTPHLPAFA